MKIGLPCRSVAQPAQGFDLRCPWHLKRRFRDTWRSSTPCPCGFENVGPALFPLVMLRDLLRAWQAVPAAAVQTGQTSCVRGGHLVTALANYFDTHEAVV